MSLKFGYELKFQQLENGVHIVHCCEYLLPTWRIRARYVWARCVCLVIGPLYDVLEWLDELREGRGG